MKRLILVVEWEPRDDHDDEASMLAHIAHHVKPANVSVLGDWRKAKVRTVEPPKRRSTDG